MHENSLTKIGVLVFLLALLSFGCESRQQSPANDRVAVQLKWMHGAQFAGLYAADRKGFFEAEGIEAELIPAAVSTDRIEPVTSGRAEFGIVGAPQIISSRQEGKPVTAVAAIHRINPVVYFALKESGIEKPRDFRGKSVLIYPQDFILTALLKKSGIRPDQIRALRPPQPLEAFYEKKVDVWTGYLTNEVIEARQAGYELNIIYPDDYGIHVYGDCIFATESTIENQPGLTERFLRAALEGWRWSIENVEEAAVISNAFEPSLDPGHLSARIAASVPLIHTGHNPVGWIQPQVWRDMHRQLIEQDLLSDQIDIDRAYTIDFLKRIYAVGK